MDIDVIVLKTLLAIGVLLYYESERIKQKDIYISLLGYRPNSYACNPLLHIHSKVARSELMCLQPINNKKRNITYCQGTQVDYNFHLASNKTRCSHIIHYETSLKIPLIDDKSVTLNS